jgi:hypothetical protein
VSVASCQCRHLLGRRSPCCSRFDVIPAGARGSLRLHVHSQRGPAEHRPQEPQRRFQGAGGDPALAQKTEWPPPGQALR